MRRGPRHLEAAALIDRYVDHDRTRLHQFQHVACHQLRRLGTRNQHRPDHQIGVFELLADVVLGRHERLDIPGHHVRQIGKPPQRDVADRDVGTRSGRRARRCRTDHARADDEDLGRLHARHATQQDSLAAARLFEEVTPLLCGHAARDLRHGDQQRQRTVAAFDRLVGAAHGARRDHRPRERLAAGEMEIGEKQLSRTNQPVLRCDRLLDLDNHLGRRVDLLDGRQQFRPHGLILLVRESAVDARSALDVDRMPPPNEFHGSGRRKRYAILVVLNFLWNSDDHNDMF